MREYTEQDIRDGIISIEYYLLVKHMRDNARKEFQGRQYLEAVGRITFNREKLACWRILPEFTASAAFMFNKNGA